MRIAKYLVEGEPIYLECSFLVNLANWRAPSTDRPRFRGAFDDAPINMAMVRLDGRYLRVNRTLCEILGYSEEELPNTT